MNSVFATATGAKVSISPESLALARTTLSQASSTNSNFSDEVVAASQSPLKSAASGAPVPIDPESLKVIKRKFADCDDDDVNAHQSPAKKSTMTDEPDYSSMFTRAGSGKAIKISEGALSAAKRAMGEQEKDENDATSEETAGPSSFTSPLLASSSSSSSRPAPGAAASTTTPLRSTPASLLLPRRQQQARGLQAAQPAGGAAPFKSPFNSPFRSPMAASAFSSPLVARPAAAPAAAAATPATAAASPLSRMCLSSPASGSAVASITPVASLSANSTNFTIRVRVTERSGAAVAYGQHGEGRFCCWLTDAADEETSTSTTSPAARLEAEAGGAAAARAAAALQYGKVYDIQSPRINVRRPAPDNPRGIVLFLDERTQVTEVPPPPSASSSSTPPAPSRPRHYSSLLPLTGVNREGEIDLAGIVRAVGVSSSASGGPSTPLKTSATTMNMTPATSSSSTMTPIKAGATSPMDSAGAGGAPTLVVTLVDSAASLTLALPHEYSKVQLSPGDLLLVYRASARPVAGSNGAFRVSAVRGRTKLLVNPESEDGRVIALGRWARSGQWAAAGGDAKMRSLASIGQKMREGGESEFVAKALVANVDAAAEETVDVCVSCGERTAKDKTLCNCAAAFGVRRLLQLEVELSDGTGLVRATACGSVAEALVGVETTEAVAMLRWNRDEWRRECRRVLYVARVFKIRRDESTPTGLSIVDVLPVPYAAYQLLIGKKLDKKRAQK